MNNNPSFFNIYSKNVISVKKRNGTDVLYYLFPDFEIHYNIIKPNSYQDWHAHRKVEEVILVLEGTILIEWKDNNSKKIYQQNLVKENQSVHRIVNDTTKNSVFIVFRKIKEKVDYKETFLNDKISF